MGFDVEDQAAELEQLAAEWDSASFWASPAGISLWSTEPPAAGDVLDGDLPYADWWAATCADYRDSEAA